MTTTLDPPVQERIIDALKWGLLNRINPQDGYYNNMDKVGEVNLEEKSFDERKKDISVDLIWDVNRMTNSVSGGNSLGGFNHQDPLLIEALIKKSEHSLSDQMRWKADIEKYFGTYFKIEDHNDNATAFNSVIESVKFFGMKQNQPFVGIDTRIIIYYRTEQTNPRQNF